MKASELNVKDLMLDDWVRFVYNPRHDEVEWNGRMIPDMFQYHDDYRLFGIPITPEILEKNKMREFEHRNPGQGGNLIKKWWHKDGSYYVSLYRVGDKCTYTVGNSITRVCGIKYIHQLQHVLRLCGIEHEITL